MVGAVAPTTAGRTDAQVMTADVVRAAVDDGNLAGAIDIHAGGHRALVEHDAVTEAVADGHRLEPGLVDVAGSDHAMTGVIPERAAFDQAASGTDSRRIGGFKQQSELEIGSAHVRTPVANAQLVCLLLLEKTRK